MNKLISIITTTVIAILLAFLVAFISVHPEQLKTETNTDTLENTVRDNNVNAVFKKDRLIEVAFMNIKPEESKQLQEQYFKKVGPIASEYGMKHIASISVNEAYSQFMNVQMIGFFEWPDKQKHQAFLEDQRFLEIKPIRDRSMSFLRMGYFEVDENTTVSFDPNELIEIYALWLDPEEGHRMQTYFNNVMPLITGEGNNYDVKFPLSLQSVDYGFDTYKPQSFGIAVWKNKESNQAFFSSEAYKQIKDDKEAALARQDVWHGQVINN